MSGVRGDQTIDHDAVARSYPTLLHALYDDDNRRRARLTFVPDDETAAESTLSYDELAQGARRMASWLRSVGVGPGSRVLLVMITGREFVEVMFGAQLIGAIAVPTYPPALLDRLDESLVRLEHIVRDCTPVVCVTNRLLLPVLGDLALRCPQMKGPYAAEDILGGDTLPPWEALRAAVDENAAAFLQYTSGSTGDPKGVVIQHKNLRANLESMGRSCNVQTDDVLVLWAPLYHDLGLVIGVFWPLYWGIHSVLMSPVAFLLRPVRWLQVMTRHGATLTGSPNFGYARAAARVSADEKRELDLSRLRFALCAAEPVQAKTLQAFGAAFSSCGLRANGITPGYGLAESTVAFSVAVIGDAPIIDVVSRRALLEGTIVEVAGAERAADPDAVEVVGLGTPIPGHGLRIVNEAGHTVGDGVIGEVLIWGPSIMQGYYGKPDATRAALVNGELRTGDRGYCRNGVLFLVGRIKDIVIVRGKNVPAEDIEHVVEGCEGVRPGAAVAFAVDDVAAGTERAMVIVETKVHGEGARRELAANVKARVTAAFGIATDVTLVPPGTTPKTSSGKKQRQETRRRYLGGTLKKRGTPRWRILWLLLRGIVGRAIVRLRR